MEPGALTRGPSGTTKGLVRSSQDWLNGFLCGGWGREREEIGYVCLFGSKSVWIGLRSGELRVQAAPSQ